MKRFALLFAVLFCSSVFAQGGGLPKIAVYVTGDLGRSESRALGTEMLDALVKSGRYIAVERSEAFVAQIENEQVTQRSGAIDDSQISRLGMQFGVQFICIADVAAIFGAHQVSARILDVETAQVVHIGRAGGTLNSVGALMAISSAVVNNMFGDGASVPATETGIAPAAAGAGPMMPSAGTAAAAGAGWSPEPGMMVDPPVMIANVTQIEMEIQGFTVSELRRTQMLNMLFGLGSLTVQQDYWGAAVCAGTSITGVVLYVSGMADMFHYRDVYGDIPEDKMAGVVTKAFGGLGLWMFGMIYGTFYRPGAYKKPESRTAAVADPFRNLNLAVFPDAGGELKLSAVYSIEF